MSDDTPDTSAPDTSAPDTTAPDTTDAVAEERPVRRPSPAAAAASRARRIGGARAAGAPVTNPSSAAGQGGGSVATAGGEKAAPAPVRVPAGEPVSTTKESVSTTKQPVGTTGKPVTTPTREPDTQPRAPRGRPSWLRWAPAIVLLVGAVVMLVLVVAVSHSVWWAQPSASSVRDRVLAAAKTCTVTTNSYSYTTFAADEKKGAACTTGAQTGRYQNAMEKLIKAKATQLKASQVAQVNSAGVESISNGGKQWTILIFGQLKVTTTSTGKGGRIDPFAARVRMDSINGTWLLSSIDTVSSATS